MAKRTVKTEAAPKAKKPVAAKAGTAKKPTTAKAALLEEAIRKKAEEIYHARVAKGEHGSAEDDWHMAEKILKGNKKTTSRKPSAKK
jgi:hypothetical protein